MTSEKRAQKFHTDDADYPDLGSASDSTMKFLRSFLRRHLAGKPVVASPNQAKAITFRNFLICHVEQYSANNSEVEMQICTFVVFCALV